MYKQRIGLNIECMIDGVDIGPSITDIVITRNIRVNFSHFAITMKINQELLRFMLNVFSVKPILNLKLENTLETEDTIFDTKEYKLLVISDVSTITQLLSDYTNNSLDTQRYTIYCLPYDAMNTSLKIVNKIYNNKTLEDIVKDQLKKVKIETEFDNSEKIDQLVIPPMNKNRMLRYLDHYFSFYNSGSIFWFYDEYSQIKENDLVIFSPKKIKKNEMELLGVVHGNDNDIVNKDIFSDDGKIRLYPMDTRMKLKDDRIFNSMVQTFRYIFIKNPKNTLYQLYQTNIEDLVNDNTFVDQIYNRMLPEDFHDNYNFWIEHTGYQDKDNVYNNWFASSYPLFNIVTSLVGYVDVNLLIPGRIIEWSPTDRNYLKYRGKFIIESVVIKFLGSQYQHWEQTTDLVLGRSNAQYQEEPVNNPNNFQPNILL